MASEKREELEKKVQRAFVETAFLRWESAVIIALTLILTAVSAFDILALPNWAPFVIFLLGRLIEAGLVASSLTDKDLYRKIMHEALRREFDPKQIADKELRGQFQEAVNYRSRIESAIQEQPVPQSDHRKPGQPGQKQAGDHQRDSRDGDAEDGLHRNGRVRRTG